MKENSGKKVLKVKVSQNDSPYPFTPQNFQVDSKVKDKGQFNMTACTFPLPTPNF